MKRIILALCTLFAFSSAAVAQPGNLALKSHAALIFDSQQGRVIYDKNADDVVPIASITKLMTSMVVLDAQLPLDEEITIESADIDVLKNTRSRLRVGASLTREQMLRLALMASENRAAAALGRAYPGGIEAFVAAMNHKAYELGMESSHFVDPTGLNSANVSTARDLAKMVEAAHGYDLIREYSTNASHAVALSNSGRSLQFNNTNNLVRSRNWEIGVSKTGFLNEAGRCLVMHAQIIGKPIIIVLLDSWGKNTRTGDANRIKKWMETGFRNRRG